MAQQYPPRTSDDFAPRDTPFPAHLKPVRGDSIKSLRPVHDGASSVASWRSQTQQPMQRSISAAQQQQQQIAPSIDAFCGLSMACNSIACHSTPPKEEADPHHHRHDMDEPVVSPLTGKGNSPQEEEAAYVVSGKRRSLDEFINDHGGNSGAVSCVLDPLSSRTLRAPPRRETDANFVRGASTIAAPAASNAPATKGASSSESRVGGSNNKGPQRDEASLVCLTAEVEFEGKEIQQLVAAMVRRQQGQLREFFDELASATQAHRDAVGEQRAAFVAQLEQLQEDWHAERQRWDQDRARMEESEATKRSLVECLQSELTLKTESLRVLADQLALTQSRLEAANARISELTQTADALRRERRNATPSTGGRGLTPTPVNTSSTNPKATSAAAAAQQSSAVKPFCFVLTGFRGEEKADLERSIMRLGGQLVNCPADQPLPAAVTHVVCSSFTTKVFAGMLKTGTQVCPADFVRKSAAQGSWVSEASARCLVGDGEYWRSAYPRVLVPEPRERDGGTAELCNVLLQSRIELVTAKEWAAQPYQASIPAPPPLINFINEIKPAFLL